jgi:hypothetical protein
MMRKFIGVALFVCLLTLVAGAQETPKPEVFGGYQYTSLDPSFNGNGWNGAANVYLNHWFGITGDVSGAYDSGLHFTTFSGGPVISTHRGRLAPYGHALFGGAHASAFGLSDNGFVMMFGGGLDMGSGKFAFRMAQVDWLMTRFNGFTDKNNVRISTGLLYRF